VLSWPGSFELCSVLAMLLLKVGCVEFTESPSIKVGLKVLPLYARLPIEPGDRVLVACEKGLGEGLEVDLIVC
jgi:hypothetical protein